MANINLYQAEQTVAQKRQAGLLDGGMLAALGLALLALLAYGGVEFYLGSLDKKMADLTSEESLGRKSLKEKDVNMAASFEQRIDKIKTEADTFAPDDPANVFENAQKTVISGAVVSKLSFSGAAADVALVADNFETLAKQILAFKGSDFWSTVDVGPTSRNEDGKVSASFTLGMNKQVK